MGSVVDHASNDSSAAAKHDGRRSFRCLVFRKDGSYIAECVDLYLLVKAETADGAIQSLHDAVLGHVQVALEMQEPQLLRRPSPLLHRLRYFWSALLESSFVTAKDALIALKLPHSFRLEA